MLACVDDIFIGCRCQDDVDKPTSCISEPFTMDEVGALSWFLGMQVKQSPGAVTVNQSRHIDDCLECYSLAECKPVGTLADISAQLSRRAALKLSQQRQYP